MAKKAGSMERKTGKDNPAFDSNAELDFLPSEKHKNDQPDLLDTFVRHSTIVPQLHEISLNRNDNDNSITGISVTVFENNIKLHNNFDPSNNNDYVDEEDDSNMKCGIGCFSPEFLQKYATKRSFMIIFSVLGLIQGMSFSYFTATITTLEKRFKISSQTAGVVMTGNEISQIIFSVFISYFGGKGHRPRWISVGVLFSAISCFVLASPQALYGSGEDSLALTEEYGYLYELTNFQDSNSLFSSSTSSPVAPPFQYATNKIGSGKKGRVSICRPAAGNKHAASCEDANSFNASSLTPLIIIFLSQFVAGVGNLLFFSLGGPYLDDNTSRSNMPTVLGTTMSLRLIGPTLGFLMASGTLKTFVNPLLTPVITPDDPRWIGAWWLGWVLLGSLLMVMSVFIALFPKRLRRKHKKSVDPDKLNTPEAIPKLADIPNAVKSLLRNKVNLFNNMAGVFYLFSAIGYWTYMPKYLETIFMQTASNASIISGVVGILFQSSGMMLSGILISKFQPGARKLALWNVAIAVVSVATMVGFTQLGCNVGNIAFGTQKTDGTWNLTSECNAACNCKTSKIFPVCHKETNTLFYSACHAGCSSFENGTISNCKCLPDPDATVQVGNCSEGCTGIFIIFLAITAMIKFFDATGRIGNMLISYRCVELKDRSLSIGLNILLISLFAFLPSPILFGRIIDNVCLVWKTCKNGGNCMHYDGEQLRYVFNLTAAAFTFVGGILDCFVLYYVKDMDLYKEPEEIMKEQGKGTENPVKVDNISLGIEKLSFSNYQKSELKEEGN